MTKFYEKSDEVVLNRCKQFVQDNMGKTSDYHVYRDALRLYTELSQSLIDSQKDFDEAITKEAEPIVLLDDGPEKEFRIIQFNQANYSLVLDMEAHKVLEQLMQIEINNRTK